MTPGYRIASTLVLLTLFGVFAASYFGWGLTSDASARARSARLGSLRGRHYVGGGPGFGK